MNDIVVGVSEATINQWIGALFQIPALQSTLFCGSQSADVPGIGTNVTVGWEIKTPPTVTLQPPSAAQWSAAIKGGSAPAALPANTLSLTFPELQVSLHNSGTTEQTTIAPVAIASMSIDDGALSVTPLAVQLDLSQASDVDRQLYTYMIVPAVLQQAQKLLGTYPLPAINVDGVQVGTPGLTLGNGLLVSGANLAADADAGNGQLGALPPSDAFVLLSPDALQAIFTAALAAVVNKTQSTGGSYSIEAPIIDVDILTVGYNGSVTLTGAQPQIDPATLPAVGLAVSVSASGGANADGLGLQYDASLSPNPLQAQIELAFNGATLELTVADVESCIAELSPAGNVAETILSGCVWPIAQLLGVAIPPLVTALVHDIGPFPVITLPSFPDVYGTPITVTPQNLSLGNWQGMLLVEGSVSVS